MFASRSHALLAGQPTVYAVRSGVVAVEAAAEQGDELLCSLHVELMTGPGEDDEFRCADLWIYVSGPHARRMSASPPAPRRQARACSSWLRLRS